MTRAQRPVCVFFSAAFSVLAGAAAAETVLGVEVEAVKYRYVATAAVNVRAGPSANAERLDTLTKGGAPDIIGRRGNWFVIAREGEPFGFVHGSFLMPVLSGALKAPVKGRARPADDAVCDYVITYKSTERIPGQAFSASDYDLSLDCELDDDELSVVLPMFMVEGPVGAADGLDAAAQPVFQISVDAPEIAAGYDRLFSAAMLYDAEKGVVRFDSLSLEDYGAAPAPDERPARNLREALAAALELALASWGAPVWEALKAPPEQ
ncbi:MAG: SH3 domain-containing protein [Rhodospirillales bacterium]